MLNQVPREFTSIMSSIVIDPCLPPLTYRRPRLRAYFATPDTSQHEAKSRRRNHRSLAIGDVRICKPLTCYPFTFLDNRRAPRRVCPSSKRRNPTSVSSAAYNRRRTYVCFQIGWDNRAPFSPDSWRSEVVGYDVATQIQQIERFLGPRWKVDRRKWASLWKERGGNHAIRHRSILETLFD